MMVMHGHGAVAAGDMMAPRRMAHRMMMHWVMPVNHMVAMVWTGGGRRGRHGERDGDRERQGDEFQGCFSQGLKVPDSVFGHRPRGASRQLATGQPPAGNLNLTDAR